MTLYKDQHAKLDLYSANLYLKQSTGWHVASLWYIILTTTHFWGQCMDYVSIK
jgi:hypothetical protein